MSHKTRTALKFISTFDIFKLSIGPSSSHTMGPMLASREFMKLIDGVSGLGQRIVVHLYGSLALTGRGHQTDRAIVFGLAGLHPSFLEHEQLIGLTENFKTSESVELPAVPHIQFLPGRDILFHKNECLAEHPNGLKFELQSGEETLISETYFSIGGGFIQTKKDLNTEVLEQTGPVVPFPFSNATELLALTHECSLTIAQIIFRNELSLRSPDAVSQGLDVLTSAMRRCVERGLTATEVLPGSLTLSRRAASMYQTFSSLDNKQLVEVSDWLSVFALAVNEENAAGHQVVTAPTNGAAGVVPAILMYLTDHLGYKSPESREVFFFTAGAFGSILKRNASISGAEAGCQAEIGGAAAMAAAGLCAVLGGTPEQIENAAEIALEHHLGLTCDPVHGLVQIPCIERNAFGATKAYLAAKMALYGNGQHRVSFDQCVESLKQIGADMSSKYKETSLGGLAVNVTSC
jgi:L-serine dehydratase